MGRYVSYRSIYWLCIGLVLVFYRSIHRLETRLRTRSLTRLRTRLDKRVYKRDISRV